MVMSDGWLWGNRVVVEGNWVGRGGGNKRVVEWVKEENEE